MKKDFIVNAEESAVKMNRLLIIYTFDKLFFFFKFDMLSVHDI